MSDLHRVTNHRPRTNNSGWSIFSKFFITTPSLLFSLVLHKSLTHWLLWELQPASQNAPNEWSGSIWLWKHRKSTNSGWTSHVQAPSPFLGGLFLERKQRRSSHRTLIRLETWTKPSTLKIGNQMRSPSHALSGNPYLQFVWPGFLTHVYD